MRFQFGELDGANLVEGKQEMLEQESETLSHSEEIKSAFYETDRLLSSDDVGIIYQLGQSIDYLSNVSNVYPKAQEIVQRISCAHIELRTLLLILVMR